MTALVAPGPAHADVAIAPGRPPSRARAVLSTPVVAWLVLAGVLFGISLVNDPGGFLGTDTGGKVLTLEHMVRGGDVDPDIGYWAERWDPEGDLHPVALTMRIGDRWVNVTTLPALLAARPLYDVGGYRATLLLPIAGTVICAAAARAVSRRCGAPTGWSAYWLVGLASPFAIYALDFWEHSLGVGLAAWGVVLLVDLAAGERGWRAAFAAGLLVGAGATMRTDVLAYGAVATLVALGGLATRGMRSDPRGALARAARTGGAVGAGLVTMVAANGLLEHVVMGGTLRADRASSAATTGGNLALRVEEGLVTTVGLNGFPGWGDYLVGGAIAGVLVAVAVLGARRADRDRRAVALGVGVVLVGYVVVLAGPLGFVPSMLATTPLAVVGVALGTRLGTKARLFVLVALATLPVVFATQYVGGAVPQWGGRYVLTSTLLLAAVGVAALPRTAPSVRRCVVGCGVAVTVFGLAWLSVRSHQVADSFAALERRPEPVLVSTLDHLLREGGAATYGRTWLTAYEDGDRVEAARIVAAAGYDSFALVSLHDDDGPPPAIGDFRAVSVDEITFIEPVRLDVTSYVRDGG